LDRTICNSPALRFIAVNQHEDHYSNAVVRRRLAAAALSRLISSQSLPGERRGLPRDHAEAPGVIPPQLDDCAVIHRQWSSLNYIASP